MKQVRQFAQFNIAVFFALVVLSSALLNGCASFGGENVDSTRKAIIIANAEVRAANLLLQDLVRRNALTDVQAVRALDHLQSAKDYLQMSLDAINMAGDPLAGATNLERANSAIGLAIALLAPLIDDSA